MPRRKPTQQERILRKAEKWLSAGKLPRLTIHVPGLYTLVKSFNLRPGVDIFMPDPFLTLEENQRNCNRWFEQFRYSRERATIYAKVKQPKHQLAVTAQRDERERNADRLADFGRILLNAEKRDDDKL